MLQSTSIKPSAMCGMESQVADIYERAERVHVRRASAVRIVTNGGRPHSVVATKTRSSLEQPSPIRTHRAAQSLELYTNKHASPLTPTYAQASAPLTLGALVEKSRPRPSSSSSVASSEASISSLPRRERIAVLQHEPSEQHAVQQATPTSPTQRVSSDRFDNRKDSMQDGPRHKLDDEMKPALRSPRSPRRQADRPTMSMFSDGPHEPKLTVGTLSSRPSSIAALKPVASKWTPSSSSSEASFRGDANPVAAARPIGHTMHKRSATTTFLDVSTKRVDMHDDAASMSSFVSEYKSSPIATYLANEDKEINPLDAQLATEAQPDDAAPPSEVNRTEWFNDSETASAAEEPAPRPMAGRRSGIIYWSPNKDPRASIAERSVEVSEDENWPLPLAHARLSRPYFTHLQQQMIAQPYSTPLQEESLPEEATRVTSHASTISHHTSSSTSTILSPTFTNEQTSSTANSTPWHSPIGDSRDTAPLLKAPQAPGYASSIAPSEVSMQWMQSSKQRLGLGGVVKKADALPWEAEQKKPTPRPQKAASVKRSQSNRFSSLLKWRRAALDDLYEREMHLVNVERQQGFA